MGRVEIGVDIGNTRVKWGRVSDARVEEMVSLSDQTTEWEGQASRWRLQAGATKWCLASVHPERRDRFAGWVVARGDELLRIDSYRQLPMRVEVDFPDRVGIDRLLAALGSRSFRAAAEPAVVVDAGTAVTVDAVAGDGTFLGGYILPGLRLLADSLHRHTAKLPLVEAFFAEDRVPGKNTVEAIRGGVVHLLLGGVQRLDALLTRNLFGGATPRRILTGGDSALLMSGLTTDWILVSELTLEGIRLASQAKP
jgi:type III pantothenate kinase